MPCGRREHRQVRLRVGQTPLPAEGGQADQPRRRVLQRWDAFRSATIATALSTWVASFSEGIDKRTFAGPRRSSRCRGPHTPQSVSQPSGYRPVPRP
jgi:hypothetical protein